jgi:hypothetical protein
MRVKSHIITADGNNVLNTHLPSAIVVLTNPYHLWLLQLTCLAATEQHAVPIELLQRAKGILFL